MNSFQDTKRTVTLWKHNEIQKVETVTEDGKKKNLLLKILGDLFGCNTALLFRAITFGSQKKTWCCPASSKKTTKGRWIFALETWKEKWTEYMRQEHVFPIFHSLCKKIKLDNGLYSWSTVYFYILEMAPMACTELGVGINGPLFFHSFSSICTTEKMTQEVNTDTLTFIAVFDLDRPTVGFCLDKSVYKNIWRSQFVSTIQIKHICIYY